MAKKHDDKPTGKPAAAQGYHIDGVKAVADMFNVMDEATRARLMKDLAEKDPNLLANIRQKMFVFNDLAKMDAKSMQLLIREVPPGFLAIALRKASPELLTFVLTCLSQKGGELLKEEILTQGPRRVSEIEAAQAIIVETAKKLAAEGKLQLPNPA